MSDLSRRSRDSKSTRDFVHPDGQIMDINPASFPMAVFSVMLASGPGAISSVGPCVVQAPCVGGKEPLVRNRVALTSQDRDQTRPRHLSRQAVGNAEFNGRHPRRRVDSTGPPALSRKPGQVVYRCEIRSRRKTARALGGSTTPRSHAAKTAPEGTTGLIGDGSHAHSASRPPGQLAHRSRAARRHGSNRRRALGSPTAPAQRTPRHQQPLPRGQPCRPTIRPCFSRLMRRQRRSTT